MAKSLPKKLFVKIEDEGAAAYFVADEDAASLVDMGKKIKVGTYQLIDTSYAEGVAKFGKSRRER